MLAKIKGYAKAFFTKYSVYTHLLLMGWNLFLTTWATKTSVTFYGFPLSATASIDWLQSHAHISTKAVGVLTLLLNMAVFYHNFKTSEAKQSDALHTLLKAGEQGKGV